MEWSRDEHARKVDRILEITYEGDGHPVRDTVISEDEILNLKILLNTETDFNKILSQL